MTNNPMRRLVLSTGLLLGAAAVLALSPDPSAAQYHDCSKAGGNVCTRTEVCIDIGVFEVCDTVGYSYYPKAPTTRM
ncbi:MAG TPA: hypothetical protein VE871_14120 [Longimicrobium sp.]|nr:hypothetical protein [Longimicrobium sp.]